MRSRLWSRRLLIGSVLGALGLFHILCPWQIGVVSGASMEPSFHSRQIILIDRGYYRHHSVHRGDVVIVRVPDGVLIKRVFALGGDSFWTLFNADDGELYRDIIEPSRLHRYRKLMPMLSAYRLSHFQVPPGTIYLVGDNVSASVDSRHFGPVPVAAIMGRVRNAPPPVGVPIYNADASSAPHPDGTKPVARASLR
jgi:signal peptidase I